MHTSRAATRQFLRGDDAHEQVTFIAAIGLREAQAQQAQLGSLAIQLQRKAFGLLPGLDVRRDFARDEAPQRVAKGFVIGRVERVLDNDRVRILEYKSRSGLGVCGQGMHDHPAHVTISLTGAKLKKTEHGKVTFPDVPPGHVFFAEAETHSAEIIGGSGTRTYIVELKGKDWKPSTG